MSQKQMSGLCCTGNGGGCLELVRNTIKLPEKLFKNLMYIFVHLVVLLRIILSASCCSIFPACNYYFIFFPL